jgi:hypothetical protein
MNIAVLVDGRSERHARRHVGDDVRAVRVGGLRPGERRKRD